jgi:hypothetical protein
MIKMAKKRKKNNNKKILMWTGITLGIILLVTLALGLLIVATGVEEEYVVNLGIGTFTFKLTNPVYHFFEQAAFVDNDKIVLGEEVCWVEMADASWMGGCVETIEWEIYKGSSKIKTIVKDLPSKKCGQISYTQCWEPTQVGNYQITTYYILDTGDVSAESATESLFVVEEGEQCEEEEYQACSGNDLYWYDSCGEKGDRAQVCQYGCLNNQCKSAPTDCTSGQEKCEGTVSYQCSAAGAWQSQGVQLNKCGVNCIDNEDCTGEDVCNAQYQCVDGGGNGGGDDPEPNPWPWIITFLVIAVLIVGVVIFVVLRRRK